MFKWGLFIIRHITLEGTKVQRTGYKFGKMTWTVMLARMLHPMHTYLLGLKKNQSIRSSADTHTNKQIKANVEPECQSLDLHQHPNQNTHKKPTANRWTYVGLQPEKEKQLTQTKQKGRPERSAHLLPTYLIWYEDQGDVVPLRREKGLA